ncbi:GumC family protein [Roseofilum casamattae]|uniref:Polysaccharide biosynthesis tyrosine autokinase n=1 Tax=Roseofilum casamattae BLCC-M143 TaxID=3022442 RepID=A0ABT7C045_9CYAN|nr:polysaccharide biosynthesis tyrosine autokinase [Roseofilum casamattae]MDJ1184826.1 polysaccharide biosynthesis tyrosine autokinase [Roseofilum casamattae BLCC-M143]
MTNSRQPFTSYSENGQGEIETLKSVSTFPLNEIPEEQTIDLAWLLSVLRRRAWIMAAATFLLSILSGASIVWMARQVVPSYEGWLQLLLEPVTAEGRSARLLLLGESGGNTNLADITGKLRIESTDLVDYETMIRVLKSPKVLDPLIEDLQEEYPEINYDNLQSKLIISRRSYEKDGKQEGTKIMLVRYEDSDTDKILFVLDRVGEAFLRYSLDERVNTLQQGIDFIDQQLPELRERVDYYQRQLQELRQRYAINFPNVEAANLSDRLLLIKRSKLDSQADLESKKRFYETFKQQIESENSIGILTFKGKAYEKILSNYQEIEVELSLKLSQFREDSIPIQMLKEKQARLAKTIQNIAQTELDTVGNEIEVLESRILSLQQSEDELNQRLQLFPDILRQYADIESSLKVKKATLQDFLEKREKLRLNASQRDFPWSIISPPKLWRSSDGQLIPKSQVSTRKQLAIALILSTLLGTGIGLIVEILDPVFHSPDEIKIDTKIKIIGVIPTDRQMKVNQKKQQKFDRFFFNSKNGDRNWHQPAYSAVFVEAFRSLYTNINLLNSKNRSIRSLVVSSASPEDGKSTVALNLAQTAAAIGKRVLLVDANLRSPHLHLSLGLHNKQGLSDTVANYLSLNEVIQASPIEENLLFLSAGQHSPDPIKLLSSQKMQYLMGQLQGFFDLVIYDTPALVGLADPYLVADYADGMILVARVEKTERSAIAQALEELRISKTNILGIVVNDVQESSSKTSRVHHEHYYSSSSTRLDEDITVL